MSDYVHNDVIDKAHEHMADVLKAGPNERAVIAYYSDGTALFYLSDKIDIVKLKELIETNQLDKGEVK